MHESDTSMSMVCPKYLLTQLDSKHPHKCPQFYCSDLALLQNIFYHVQKYINIKYIKAQKIKTFIYYINFIFIYKIFLHSIQFIYSFINFFYKFFFTLPNILYSKGYYFYFFFYNFFFALGLFNIFYFFYFTMQFILSSCLENLMPVIFIGVWLHSLYSPSPHSLILKLI